MLHTKNTPKTPHSRIIDILLTINLDIKAIHNGNMIDMKRGSESMAPNVKTPKKYTAA